MQRHRLAADERDRTATIATLRQKWGAPVGSAHRADPRILGDSGSLRTSCCPPVMPAARQCSNKPAVLEAMCGAAADSLVLTDDQRDKAATERALRSEWGNQYGSTFALLKQWLGAVLPQSANEGLAHARDFEGVAIFNRPAVLRWLVQLVIGRGAGGASSGGSAQDLGARRRKLETMMGDSSGAYHRGPDSAVLQQEYRDLVERGVGQQ